MKSVYAYCLLFPFRLKIKFYETSPVDSSFVTFFDSFHFVKVSPSNHDLSFLRTLLAVFEDQNQGLCFPPDLLVTQNFHIWHINPYFVKFIANIYLMHKSHCDRASRNLVGRVSFGYHRFAWCILWDNQNETSRWMYL